LAHHDGACACRRIETDDPAAPQLLHALDRAPFAHRINLEFAAGQLRLLPAFREILHAAGHAFGIVLIILDVEVFILEEALLDGDAPGAIVGVAVALNANGARHGIILDLHSGAWKVQGAYVAFKLPPVRAARSRHVLTAKARDAFIVI